MFIITTLAANMTITAPSPKADKAPIMKEPAHLPTEIWHQITSNVDVDSLEAMAKCPSSMMADCAKWYLRSWRHKMEPKLDELFWLWEMIKGLVEQVTEERGAVDVTLWKSWCVAANKFCSLATEVCESWPKSQLRGREWAKGRSNSECWSRGQYHLDAETELLRRKAVIVAGITCRLSRVTDLLWINGNARRLATVALDLHNSYHHPTAMFIDQNLMNEYHARVEELREPLPDFHAGFITQGGQVVLPFPAMDDFFFVLGRADETREGALDSLLSAWRKVVLAAMDRRYLYD